MFRIDTHAITALRDRLLEAGAAPSTATGGAGDDVFAGDAEGYALFEAAVEAMVLILSADGTIRDAERGVLRGAVLELTAGSVRGAEIDRMADAAGKRIAEQGADERLAAIGPVLDGERLAAEAAFVLSAAMAFADSDVADVEHAMLTRLAGVLHIDEERAAHLLRELDV